MRVWRRRALVVGGAAVALAAVSVVAILQGSTSSVGSPAGDDPDALRVVGDGDLPTRRPDLRPARAPLSAQEAGYAAHLATRRSEIPDDATDVHGDAGAQILFTDLPRVADADGSARLAVVVLYDYTSDRGYDVLVDLTTSTVRATESHPELQPPITPDEADVALEVAIDSPERLAFRDQFEREMGVPLLTRDQLAYKAGAWTSDGTSRAGKECGMHRCAQIFVQSPSGSYLGTSDFVVDLTTRRIVVLEDP